jgi:hypothetical protein
VLGFREHEDPDAVGDAIVAVLAEGSSQPGRGGR